MSSTCSSRFSVSARLAPKNSSSSAIITGAAAINASETTTAVDADDGAGPVFVDYNWVFHPSKISENEAEMTKNEAKITKNEAEMTKNEAGIAKNDLRARLS